MSSVPCPLCGAVPTGLTEHGLGWCPRCRLYFAPQPGAHVRPERPSRCSAALGTAWCELNAGHQGAHAGTAGGQPITWPLLTEVPNAG